MKFGMCTPPENAPAVAAAGYDAIELHIQNHLVPLADDDAFAPMRDAITSAPLPAPAANCFLPGSLPSTGPDADFDAIERYAITAFTRAAQIGIHTLVFGSGGSRKLTDGFSREDAFTQFIDLNRRLAPIAADRGVVIVIEPLHAAECNFINSLAEGARVVESVDHPHVRLLADFFHMLRDGESANEIVRFADMLHHVHLAEPATRTTPGIEGTDFAPFFDALKQAGYDDHIMIEGNFPNGLPTNAPNSLQLMQAWAK